MRLVTKIVALDEALDRAGIPHAFGGALALAFCTLDPRATNDIDCNVFVPSTDPEPVLAALPDGVAVTATAGRVIRRDGQVRLWWEDNPVDLFFDYAELHHQAATAVRRVPFAGRLLPVLSCHHVVVFKALFDRTKDWADIEAVLAAGQVDPVGARVALVDMLGHDDHRIARWDLALRTAADPP